MILLIFGTDIQYCLCFTACHKRTRLEYIQWEFLSVFDIQQVGSFHLHLAGRPTHLRPSPLRSASQQKSMKIGNKNKSSLNGYGYGCCLFDDEFQKLACFCQIYLPAHRNIFNWNSCLVLLLIRFPASRKLLIVLPALGFCFDYLCTSSICLL